MPPGFQPGRHSAYSMQSISLHVLQRLDVYPAPLPLVIDHPPADVLPAQPAQIAQLQHLALGGIAQPVDDLARLADRLAQLLRLILDVPADVHECAGAVFHLAARVRAAGAKRLHGARRAHRHLPIALRPLLHAKNAPVRVHHPLHERPRAHRVHRAAVHAHVARQPLRRHAALLLMTAITTGFACIHRISPSSQGYKYEHIFAFYALY